MLANLYLAKQELFKVLRQEEGFVGITISGESKNIKSLALQVLVRKQDSPVVAKIPRFIGLYRVRYKVVGDDVPVQQLDIGDPLE